jgi:hypothetical protein
MYNVLMYTECPTNTTRFTNKKQKQLWWTVITCQMYSNIFCLLGTTTYIKLYYNIFVHNQIIN